MLQTRRDNIWPPSLKSNNRSASSVYPCTRACIRVYIQPSNCHSSWTSWTCPPPRFQSTRRYPAFRAPSATQPPHVSHFPLRPSPGTAPTATSLGQYQGHRVRTPPPMTPPPSRGRGRIVEGSCPPPLAQGGGGGGTHSLLRTPGGGTTNGPDTTPTPAICQNLRGGGVGERVGGCAQPTTITCIPQGCVRVSGHGGIEVCMR